MKIFCSTDSKNPTKGIEEALAGFRIASAPSRPKVIYPPPTLPRGYQPFHRFDDVGGGSAPSTSTTTSVPAGRQLNASARGAMLKDPSQISERCGASITPTAICSSTFSIPHFSYCVSHISCLSHRLTMCIRWMSIVESCFCVTQYNYWKNWKTTEHLIMWLWIATQ